MMLLNSDFSQRAIVTPDDYQWIPSPQPGVERLMLDRIGREQARATSLVRYAPGSKFPAHSHPGGEEILVLDGIFTENGVDYPAGRYLRSPDGSSHQPSSRDGTTIFVKLRQMSADERQPVRINTQEAANWHGQPQRQVCPLFSGASETVQLQKLAPGERIFCAPLVGGAELILLQGEIRAPEGRYESGSWLRFPPGDMPALIATASGALFYLKTGHLSPTTLTGATL
ncbi:TPA: cupin domain-containing protein [Enterobacter kobei]|uniref:cupin domain-containing protein n=1 Tax=Enterobacter TaxID=547 RepID=UPI000E40ED9C|nr:MULTISPECIES: cupin domain-containing protein [Enterobacter]MBT1946782.1 cupin domain-containing protein [Enterobacter kobei]MCE1358246.1 cupin domain-containing protein [Enterobacter kobei]MCK6793334.1 cupin domain-containing protein [Enterobacter kobei]RGD10882.1 anti-sigma factor [Enterobacter sp. AM17-18]UKB67033.1 cupin domain-containing protein [Enterobacter cloacae complex sp. ECL414]